MRFVGDWFVCVASFVFLIAADVFVCRCIVAACGLCVRRVCFCLWLMLFMVGGVFDCGLCDVCGCCCCLCLLSGGVVWFVLSVRVLVYCLWFMICVVCRSCFVMFSGLVLRLWVLCLFVVDVCVVCVSLWFVCLCLFLVDCLWVV